MKNEILNNYLINGILDIDRILDDFYNYVYIIVKNGVSVSITDEDIEEITLRDIKQEMISLEYKLNKIINKTKSVLRCL